MDKINPEDAKSKFKFERRAEYFKKYRDLPYQIIHIPLDAAGTLEIPRGGDLCKVVHASDLTANVDIRFNYKDAEAINFFPYRKVNTYFERVFVSWATQAGAWVDLILGVEEWFEITDFL